MATITITRWEQLRLIKALDMIIQAREASLQEYIALCGTVEEWQTGPYRVAVEKVGDNYRDEIAKLQELQERLRA